ncbi:MAG: arsenate reductase ArsC [Flavobacteriales bacterium]|nr:arsenate reductase ArsC [Flavobacteriales bacterium]
MSGPIKRILVLCTGNSCRSQMAEGYLRHFARGRAQVFSAGVEGHGVNPRAIEVMNEDGIDISGHTSKTVDALAGQSFDLVITVCDSARENCPWFPAKAERLHYDFPDPAKATGSEAEIMTEFQRVRGMIKAYCERLVREAVGHE